MAAFIPIVYREDGSYILPVYISHHGSNMIDIEFIPRSMLETFIADARLTGQVVEPVIHHGFH
jgi:hypothetical protein